MSVLLECEPGDAFYCLQEFDASPDGKGFSWETARHFCVGEKLRYVTFREDPNYKGRPTSWMAVFTAADGNRYAATQTYFVTEECWKGLRQHFARKKRIGGSKKTKKAAPQRSGGAKKQSMAPSSKK